MGKRDYFRKGTIEMMALSLLSESDLYGYQIVQAITERSEGAINVQIGSLYPVLYKLLEDGCVSDKEVPAGKRRIRVYYHIEPKGLKMLQELRSEHDAFEHGLAKVLTPYEGAVKEDRPTE